VKIWITGIAGFLGSHLAEQLIKEGHEVVGNDTYVCGDINNLNEFWGGNFSDGRLMQIDCCDHAAMKSYMDIHKPDVLIHAACCAHEGFSPYSPYYISNSVYGGSVAPFSAAIAAGVKRIVFMSTMARYGKQEPPFTEEMAPKPCDPYGIAKVAAEDTLINLCETHGVKWSIACPHNIIGTRQKYDDPYRNVVSIFLNRMFQGKPAVIYGDGEQTRCFSPIGDVLPSLVKMVNGEADGEIVNIGPDGDTNKMTIKELAAKIANLTGYNGAPEHYRERGCDVVHAHCSSDKARRLFGFEQKEDLDKCFADMALDIRLKGTKPFDYFLPVEIVSDKTPRTWLEKLL